MLGGFIKRVCCRQDTHSGSVRPFSCSVTVSTANFMVGLSHPGGVEILLVTSCYRIRDNIRPNGPLGSSAVSITESHTFRKASYSETSVN